MRLEKIITIFPVIRLEPITMIPEPPPDIKEELEEQGWRYIGVQVNGRIEYAYEGKFKGNYRSFRGFVWISQMAISIKNLPLSAKLGSHSLCFSQTRNGWYLVHFNKGENPLARICAIEQYLKDVGE